MNRISYAYDRGGRLCRVTDSTGVASEYTYNSRGQRTVVRNNIREDVWQKTGYTYFPITNISMKETATISAGKDLKEPPDTRMTDGACRGSGETQDSFQ